MADFIHPLLDALKGAGGFSIHLPTGHKPTSGYMVSLAKYERTFPLVTLGREDLIQYIADHRIELQVAYLGGWIRNDVAYLDLSINVLTLQEALHLGLSQNQQAIHDVAAGTDILVAVPPDQQVA